MPEFQVFVMLFGRLGEDFTVTEEPLFTHTQS